MTETGRPLAVDLFSGVGGMSLGFEQAGFDVACAVEKNPVHAAAHKYNFPFCDVLNEDVSKLSGSEIRKRSRIVDNKVSLVFGGSPCQGFSLIGKRSLDDPRNILVSHFMRIVSELEADYFVFENVRGLTVGQHKKFLNEIIEGFEGLGYNLISPYKVLNASSYGVPQDRLRLFVVGARNGLTVPLYPAPTTYAAGKKAVDGCVPSPSVADALSDIPDAELYDVLNISDKAEVELGSPSSYAALMRGLVSDPNDFVAPREYDSRILTSSRRSNHNEVSRRRFAEAVPGKMEPISRFLKLDPAGVCNTLRAGTASDRGSFTAARPIHPLYARCITVREMARLHSYPDWFRFNSTKWSGAQQVGNSVPPLLARAVASEIIKAIGYLPEKPESAIAPGDESLLYVTEKSAAEVFKKAS